MVVARSIDNGEGGLLLEAGACLDERSIRVLKSWGVDWIEIESPGEVAAPARPAPEPEPQLSAALAASREAFSLHPDHPVLRLLAGVVRRPRESSAARRRGST